MASFLYAPRDVVSFEAALATGGEQVDGLWGAFGGFRLRRILTTEIANKRQLLGHRRSLAADASYDLEMRELCTYGLADADLAQMQDARVRVLHRRLASESWQQLPLLAQVQREAHRRQTVVFGLLRGQWHRYLEACHEVALLGGPLPQLRELAEKLPQLTLRHERSWREGSAWLSSGDPARQLRRAGARGLRGLLAAKAEPAPLSAAENASLRGRSPAVRPRASSQTRTPIASSPSSPNSSASSQAAPQLAWPMLVACLDALDAYAEALGLDCQTTPSALRRPPLAQGATAGLHAGARERLPAEGATWPGTA